MCKVVLNFRGMWSKMLTSVRTDPFPLQRKKDNSMAPFCSKTLIFPGISSNPCVSNFRVTRSSTSKKLLLLSTKAPRWTKSWRAIVTNIPLTRDNSSVFFHICNMETYICPSLDFLSGPKFLAVCIYCTRCRSSFFFLWFICICANSASTRYRFAFIYIHNFFLASIVSLLLLYYHELSV